METEVEGDDWEIVTEDELGELSKTINKMTQDINILVNQKQNLLLDVSHELKTPLFVLEGYLDTLLDGAINDSNVNKKFLLTHPFLYREL